MSSPPPFQGFYNRRLKGKVAGYAPKNVTISIISIRFSKEYHLMT